MKANRRTKRMARALYRLCVVNDALDAGRARIVARHLAESRRRGALPVLAVFQRQVRLDRDRRAAVVESAAPLDEALRAQIRDGLARAYGEGVDASFDENPALIAGLRIKVGSEVYDGSIRGKLAALGARL